MSAWLRLLLVFVLAATGAGVAAQDVTAPVASLDRDRVRLGETVALTVAADRMLAGAPDISALEGDFDVLGRSGRSERIGGRSASVWTFTLRPRDEGVLGIASIDWAGGRTQPLSVTVLPAARGSADAGDRVYLDVEIDDRNPYVQQALVFTIRLGYRVALLEGRLEAPDVSDAVLRQIGEDLSYQREAGGETYRVVERRYVLLPERSGTLVVGPVRFVGRIQSGGGIYGGFESVAEASDPIEIEVRPRPANAPLPWVPARDIAIEMEPPPPRARLGDPLTLSLRVRAKGVLSSQLPELALPEADGFQVFPESVELSERIEGGTLVAEGVRRFVVVPLSGDRLEIPPSGLEWWDVGQGQSANVAIPGVSLELLAARSTVTGGARSTVGGAASTRAPEPPSGGSAARPWMLLSLMLALGWAATAVWLSRRPLASVGHAGTDPAGMERARRRGGAAARLRRVLAEGDLTAIDDALVRAAPHPAAGLGGVCEQLSDAGQREAVQALQSARWHHGDPAAAREQLRHAFSQGPRWHGTHDVPSSVTEPVPPLYPHRGG